MFNEFDKTFFMQIAINEAYKAYKKGEVPVGACVVNINTKKIISKGFNKRILKHNAIKHAEVICIERACKKFKDFRLENTAMFVTLFPCVMCMGAILNSRIEEVYIGTPSDRINNNLIESIFNSSEFNHKVYYEVGVLKNECSNLLKKFFLERRNVNKNSNNK